MWPTQCSLWTTLLFVNFLQCILANDNCGPGLDTPGVTIPKGDIVLLKGNPLEIFCVLNTSHAKTGGRTSSHLVFYHNDRQVLNEFVNVVNETTIRLYVKEPPFDKSMYYCKLQSTMPGGRTEESVCLNTVYVGTPPEPVTDFNCVSHNWENLTCTWKKPVNYVKTTYSLRYRLPGRAGGRLLYNCPDSLDNIESRCFWDPSTNPHYRQPYEYYYFTMTGENILGNVTFPTIKFHHYNHVIPTAPRNLTQVNQTLHSVLLEWLVPFPMTIFPPGVIHWVRYQSEWDSRDHWEEVNTAYMNPKSMAPNHTRYLNVTGLKYSNALYDIKVSMKSATAAIGPEMWSIPANLTFKTLPTTPGAAPRTDVGSFEITGGLSHRDIYVYWQHISEFLKNGDLFEYKVFNLVFGVKTLMDPHESTKAYAKFRGMNFGAHTFIVHSANKEGLSRDYSVVHIPAYSQSPLEPSSFTKIAFGKGVYELSWRAPLEHTFPIDNYTIFWCENDRDRPYQCSGLLNWTHVDREQVMTRIEVPEHKIYQFAISANAKHGSSGMVWSSCTVIHDKVVGKMKNVWINNIGPRIIDVRWKLECSDRVGLVVGFRISYCPIYGPLNVSCKEEEQNVTIKGNSETVEGRINNLKPYTTYMVAVAVVTKNGVGLMSDPLLNTTLEDKPDTPPTQITASEITNTSMKVSWVLPAQSNGLLRDIFVYYNGNKTRVDATNGIVLESLESYVNYDIQVQACTVKCSEMSPQISARTLVGVPGQVRPPYIRFLNTSELEVSWSPPAFSGGDINYYKLVVLRSNAEANTSQVYHNVTGNVTRIQIPDCLGEGSSFDYKVQVRAINVDKAGVEYMGPWSKPSNNNCLNSVPGPSITVIAWVVSIIVITGVVIFAAYCLKRGWQRCKVMKEVEVKLPPGLATTGEKDSHITVHSWPMSEVRDPHRARPSADEERLLQKKEDRERHGRNPSGDSSGCSSGHESVSSSITSATHMSSDSGTGADQRTGSPDGVFSESPVWESASLNQNVAEGDNDPYVRMGNITSGSVARSTPNLSDLVEPGAYLGTWSSTGYISMPSNEDIAGTSYCRVGLDPTTPSRQPATGYITIASMRDSPAPTPTYVAHRPKEPTKAYVTMPAALADASDSYCRMGLHPAQTPVTKIATGYVALTEGNLVAEGSSNGNYVPHSDHGASVFTPVNGDHNSVTSV